MMRIECAGLFRCCMQSVREHVAFAARINKDIMQREHKCWVGEMITCHYENNPASVLVLGDDNVWKVRLL